MPNPDTIGAPGTYLNYASQGKAVRHAQQVQVVPVCVCRCHCRGDMVNTAMQKLNIKNQSVILSLFTLQCPAFHEELPTRQDKAGLCPSGPCGAQPCLVLFRIKKIPLGFHFSWKIDFSPLVRALAKMLEDHHTTQIHHALMIKRNSEVRATVVHT